MKGNKNEKIFFLITSDSHFNGWKNMRCLDIFRMFLTNHKKLGALYNRNL